MNTPLTIVTGASRGLGLALAESLLQRGHRVLCLSRHPPPLSHAMLLCWQADLADSAPVAARLEAWLGELDAATLASATLINNAGVVSELAPMSAIPAADLSNALRVGLEAPMLLASAFLRASGAWALPRRLLFVSSGLGRYAIAGSASYCAAKAGMDNLARAIALEEANKPNGARVSSVAPGIIDTDMQAQLRSADPAAFPEQARFSDFKASGRLDSPAAAAAKLLRLLERDDFGQEPLTDVRNA